MEWGYLLILLNSVFMCVMAAVRKEYQRKVNATLKSTLMFMGVSSLFVCLIGLGYCFFVDFALIKKADAFVVGLSAVFALILTINTCLCIFGAKYGSLAMITTFATLGTLVISTVYGLISDPLKNKLNFFNIVGLILAVVIIVLGFLASKTTGDKDEKTEQKSSKVFIFICLAVFLFNGSALSVYSIFTSNRASYGGFNFIFLYLFFCVLICAIALSCLFWIHKKSKKPFSINDCVSCKPILCSLIYGVVFFCAELCALTTTSLLPIVIQAPLSFAINVVVVGVVDYLIYKQRLTRIQLIQISLAIVCGILFAL